MLHVNVHHLLHNITCLSIWSTDFEVVDHIVSERKGFLAAQSVQLRNLVTSYSHSFPLALKDWHIFPVG